MTVFLLLSYSTVNADKVRYEPNLFSV